MSQNRAGRNAEPSAPFPHVSAPANAEAMGVAGGVYERMGKSGSCVTKRKKNKIIGPKGVSQGRDYGIPEANTPGLAASAPSGLNESRQIINSASHDSAAAAVFTCEASRRRSLAPGD